MWFVGFTPNLAAAAMIAGANSKGQPQPLNGQTVAGRTVYGAAGSSLAGPIWGDAMKVIQQWLPDESFTPPGAQAVSGATTTIPSLYGQNPSEAARRLREAGFNPVVGPSVDSSNSAGTVAYLSPGSGTSAPSGTTVTIYVSDGSPYVAPQQPDEQRRREQCRRQRQRQRERERPGPRSALRPLSRAGDGPPPRPSHRRRGHAPAAAAGPSPDRWPACPGPGRRGRRSCA